MLSLEQLADDANRALAQAPAEEVLRWATDTFGERFAVAASMGDTVLAHLASRVQPGIDVLFVDTGYHFVETIGTRDAVAAAYPVRVLDIRPVSTVAEQDALYGPRLHDRDPDRCCAMRKVAPSTMPCATTTHGPADCVATNRRLVQMRRSSGGTTSAAR